jgi:hypothetical protein
LSFSSHYVFCITVKECKSIPGTTADFGGIETDTFGLEAKPPPPPPAKLPKATELQQHARKKGKVSLHELQSIIGFLSWCSQVVRLGRRFLRRLYDATSCYPQNGNQRRRLTADMKTDLRRWQRFLPVLNGIAIILPEREQWFPWTEASGNNGLGGYFLLTTTAPLDNLTWSSAFCKPPTHYDSCKHIDYKDMLAMPTAFPLRRPNFFGKDIDIRTV